MSNADIVMLIIFSPLVVMAIAMLVLLLALSIQLLCMASKELWDAVRGRSNLHKW